MSPRGERAMVPPARPTSYYDRPILKAPTWRESNVGAYLFLGGLAGGSALLAGGADSTARPDLARSAKLVALGSISLSTAALVHDLGRPSRFANMLRVLKPTSPMSVGSWLLAGFGPAAGVAAVTDLSGRFSRLGRVATLAAAGLGPLVASYTSVLIADTAVPAWHDAHRLLPFVFVGSGGAAAAGAGLIAAPTAQAGPARRLALLSTVLEGAAASQLAGGARIERRSYRTGRPAALLHAARALTVGGVGLMLVGRRSRTLSAVSGASLMAGSLLTRLGIYEAGVASSQDPEETVLGQRARAQTSSS